jgi:ATP/maltotriose-dependent transcriptional regulator MalT
VSEAAVRRWLSSLGQPAPLPDPELIALLTAHGRLPAPPAALAVGEALRDLIVQAIDRLRPAAGVPRAQQLPHIVLTMCFVEGVKWVSAADRLGISPRQLTRERTRALLLLRDELNAMTAAASASAGAGVAVRMEQIPAIAGYRPRPQVTRALGELLATQHLVHVHGPRGIGKTSLVAEFAAEKARRAPVLWIRFRAGVNTSLGAVLFELAEYLSSRGRPTLATKLAEADLDPDVGIASRLAIKDLAASPQLLVFDDYHLADADPAVAGFLAEAVSRLPELRVITVGRHASGTTGVGSGMALPALTRIEAQDLLANLDVQLGPVMAGSIHAWTAGIPQLIRLAASWLKSATPEEVSAGLTALGHQDEVRDFLLAAISEVLDSADRAILDAASVFRDRFTDEALAYVAELTVGAIEDASRRLVRRHLASRGRQGDVAFFHGSVREYFYARLEPDERRRLHTRAADWYGQHGSATEQRYHRGLAKP